MKKKTFHLITSGILSVSLLLGSVVAAQGAEDELFFGQEDYGSPTEYVEDEYSMDGNNDEINNDGYSFEDALFSDGDGVITEEIAQEEWSGSPEEYTEPQSSYQSEIPDTGVDDYASAETEEVQDSLVQEDYAEGTDEFLSVTDAGDITSSPEVTEDVEPEEIHEELLGGPLDPYGESAYGTPALASVSDIDASVIMTSCDIYDGSNVEYQNYSTWSSPVTSYLTTSPDGGLMRVQSGALDGKLLIEYFDRSYNFQSNVTLNLSYPIFGGFFEGSDAYYVLTGQRNNEESNDKVVFNVAKYTKNWDYVASAFIKGANTIGPFDAGSARFAMSGKYLIVRTCHEMYTSSDGYNHQANVTIQIDTDTMRVTDYFTDVANSSVGYVSHSFNQFVFIEDDAIVSLDHGDAYPRGLTLIKYPSTISSGYFESGWNTNCQVNNVFSFPGEVGDNYTGASVGGFLASDSHYLIAGNYNDSSDRYAARNVFVEAVPKSGGSPVVRYFTSYAGSSDTASTPHLVSLGGNRFLLLWSSQATVYYMPVDGSGQSCGDLYSFKGNLSDCVPQVIGNKVVWYTWNYDTNVFYEINTSDLSDHDAVIIVNGHKYEFNNPPENGEIEGSCRICGEKTRRAVPTGIEVWLNKNGTYYWEDAGIELSPGEKAEYEIGWSYTSRLSESLNDCEVISSDPDILYPYAPALSDSFIIAGSKPGKATATFRSKYNPAVSEAYTFYVNCLQDNSVKRTDLYEEIVYTGSPIKVPVKVTFDGKTLTEGTDYKLSWSENINAGTAKVTAQGIGKYTGSGSTTFTIKPAYLKKEMFTVPSAPLTETGSQLKPKVSGGELREGVDYEITGYTSNTYPGTGYVVVSGKGNYQGDCRIPFEIKKSPTPIKRIDASMFTVPSSPFIETGSQIKPSVVGSADGKKLKKGTDYVIDGYSSNVNPGTGYVIVRGIGDYCGTISVPFVIISDSTLYLSVSKDPLLAGESATISVTGAKGKISYKSSNSAVAAVSGKGIVTAKKPGTATITVKDKTKSAKIKIHVVPGATSSIKAVNTASGVKVTWSKVTGATGYDLYCDGNMVLSNRNVLSYTGYASNGRTYTYKVVARCSAGASTKSKSVKQTYLKQPEITELTSRKSGRIGCWWSKNKDSSGSEMQYSTQKDFKSGIKTVDVPKTDTRNYVVNGLPSGKTYYVRVRRYKKSGNQKTYSAWSVVKSIRVS